MCLPQLLVEVSIVNGVEHVHKEDIAGYVNNKLELFRMAREEVEESWLECWAKYLNTPNAESNIQSSIIKRVGDVETQWRHHLTGAKAYEAVETIVGYLMAATFPTENGSVWNPQHLMTTTT